MTDMTLQEALAQIRAEEPTDMPWRSGVFGGVDRRCAEAIATILNAVASGDLIPRADAELAVAEAIRRAADAVRAVLTNSPTGEWGEEGISMSRATERSVLALVPADALAEVQRMRDAVEALVVVLDRNDKKGPIPDVEMMFCWLASQGVRAAFRKIAQKGEAT